jgi:hypothetical protein
MNGNDIWIEGEKVSLSAKLEGGHEIGAQNAEGTNEPTIESSLRPPKSASMLIVDKSGQWVIYRGMRYLWIPKTYRGQWVAHGKVLVKLAPPNEPASVKRAEEDSGDNNKDWILASWDQPALYHPFT